MIAQGSKTLCSLDQEMQRKGIWEERVRRNQGKNALSNSHNTLKVWQGMTKMWSNFKEEYRHLKYSEKFYDTSASGPGFRDPV